MAVADLLVEMTRKDLKILKKLYALNGTPQNYVSYTTIDNYIRWFERDSHLKHIKIYCFNGNFSDGTFVIIVSSNFRLFHIFFSKIRKFAQKVSFFSFRMDVMCTLTHYQNHTKISHVCWN